MKTEELRKKNEKELQTTLVDLLREQFNLRMQNVTGQLAQNHRMQVVRRDIARAKTILHQKRNEANSQ